MVYFEFWVELVFGLVGNSGENGSKLAIFVMLDSLRLGVGVHA